MQTLYVHGSNRRSWLSRLGSCKENIWTMAKREGERRDKGFLISGLPPNQSKMRKLSGESSIRVGSNPSLGKKFISCHFVLHKSSLPSFALRQTLPTLRHTEGGGEMDEECLHCLVWSGQGGKAQTMYLIHKRIRPRKFST